MRRAFSGQDNMLAASTTVFNRGNSALQQAGQSLKLLSKSKRRSGKLWRTALVCLCSPFLFGCQNLARNYIPDELMTSTVDKSMAPYVTKNDQIDLSQIDLSTYDDPAKTAERARFVATLMTLSDKKCELHKATIMSNANNWNVATGVATILFAGYASVAHSANAAANAAAAAAATTGIQGQFNQEVYQGKLSTAILRAIDVARAKAYAKVTAGMKTTDYTAVQLVADINQYHASCSLMAGVTELTKAIDNRKKSRAEIEGDIARLKTEITNTNGLYETTHVAAMKSQLQKQVTDLLQASD